jgi:hypothetical protein
MTQLNQRDDCSRGIHKTRTHRIVAATMGSASIALLLLAFIARRQVSPLWGVGAFAIACVLGIAWRASKKEGHAEARQGARSLIENVPEQPVDRVDKLAMRSARLRRFVELHAPECLIEAERRLVREAIAKVDPAVAFSILGMVRARGDDLDESD